MAECVNQPISADHASYVKYNDADSYRTDYLHLLSTRMFDLLKIGIFCDTILVTSDKEVFAHSIVLAAASHVFETALSNFAGDTSSYRLELIGLDSRAMNDILRLIYTGRLQTSLNEEEHAKLIDVCSQLGLDWIQPNVNIVNLRNTSVKKDNLDEHSDPGCSVSDACDEDLLSRANMISSDIDTINEEHLKLADDTALNLLEIEDTNETNHQVSLRNQYNEHYMCDRCGRQFIDSSVLCFHREECLLDTTEPLDDPGGASEMTEGASFTRVVLDIENTDVCRQLQQAADERTDEANKGNGDQYESSGLNFYKCGECDRQFQYVSHLHVHMRRHTNARPYECTVCGQRFRDNCLRTHMLTHTGERPHECTECSRTFSRAADLVVHMKTHTGIRAHVCELCERAFSKKGDLARHKRVHSGERPYVCEECGKAFKILFHLRLHASVHSATRGYSCELCPKAFGNAAQLHKHVKIHSGERPHACEICSRRFNRAANLRAHMKVHEARLPNTGAEDVNPSEGDYIVNGDLIYCKLEPSEQQDVLVALPYSVIQGYTQVNETPS